MGFNRFLKKSIINSPQIYRGVQIKFNAFFTEKTDNYIYLFNKKNLKSFLILHHENL